MKQLLYIATILVLASCGSEATDGEQAAVPADTTLTQVQQDSLDKAKEEEEMAEHVIEGSLDALNR